MLQGSAAHDAAPREPQSLTRTWRTSRVDLREAEEGGAAGGKAGGKAAGGGAALESAEPALVRVTLPEQ